MGTTHFSGLNLKVTAIPENAAGNHTVTGIQVGDTLLAVVLHKITLTEGTPNSVGVTAQNITSEFTITGPNTINNGGGTSLADSLAFVFWLDQDL